MKVKGHPLLIVLVILALVATPASARPAEPKPTGAETVFTPVEATPAATPKVSKTVLNEDKNASGPALYIVLLREAPTASYDGSIPGLSATSPSFTGASKLDAKSSASQAYRSYLSNRQDQFIAELESQFSRPIQVAFKFQTALNGFVAELTPAEAAAIAQRNDVRLVERNGLAKLDTDAGPAWIGAPGIWDGSNTGGLPGTKGEGIVVGILDTGINSDHPSFAATGPYDGYVHSNPFPSYVGVCDPTDPSYDASFVCNDKLIGAWEYAYPLRGANTDYPTPEDEDGHGSHTASTTAGNVVTATLSAPTTSITRLISGVAPHANIIAYDVCHSGGCPFVATAAAVDQAVFDGVDVINYSISGGEDPYSEATDLGFLEAYNAGVFVSTSAGNEGPGASTVAHRGPWVSASAAATHNRALPNSLTSMTGDGAPPADMTGKGFTSGYGPAPIVYAGNYGNALCAPGAFTAGTFNGEIVVCDRGTYARVDKAQSVADGGAGGFVLANDVASGASLSGDAYAIPGVHITYADGVVLKAWLASGTIHNATITGAVESINPANGDVLAAFSSRGPNTTFDVLKPDLTAPGVDIWAAINTPDPANPASDEYGFMSGTSMASPHTAGAAALMTGVHPLWSSAEILSAMMMTADHTVLREDGVTAADWFDMGAGRVDLNLAAKTGLVLDETYTNFIAANPAIGGDVKTLNLPSLTDNQCLQNCSWSRTFSSVASASVEWTISSTGAVPVTATPDVFTIAAGSTQAVTFTADATGLVNGAWEFAMVTLTPNNPAIPTLNIPVSIIPSSGVLPSLVTVNTRRDAGSQVVPGIQSIAAPALTIESLGLVKGTLTTASIPEDPTNDDPYDNPNDGAFFVLVTVPANTTRLVAEVTASAATDVDLFVGLDDGDGIPELAEEVCVSATPVALERCDLLAPAAGTYWVLAENWQASTVGATDDITLSVGVVPNTDAGNMTVTGPASAAELTPYDLTLFYDITPSMAGDRWYGAFTLGSTAATPGDIGLVPVDVVRHSDDVVKSGPTLAAPGDPISYEVAVGSNVTPTDLTYTITDTIPAGLTLNPASIVVSAGSFTVNGSTIVWTLPMPAPHISYDITTSLNDPLCDTGFSGYVDLQASSIFPQSTITGDTVAYTAFSTGDPFDFFGQPYTGMGFTDDGFAVFDVATNYNDPSSTPWTPQTVPNAALPNNLLAALWQDMEIVYNSGANRGVSLATAGPTVAIVEYDDVQLYGDPTNQYDFEIVAYRTPSNAPGDYEYVFAYDNLDGALTGPLTVGVENVGGLYGAALVNNGNASAVLSNGFMVCLDRVQVGGPASMTYDVTVDAGATMPFITNSAVSMVDNPGSVSTSADWTLNLDLGLLPIYLPIVHKPALP